MRFEISREALLRPLGRIVGVVERRQSLPVLTNLLLEADENGLRLVTTDLEVEVQARTEAEGIEAGRITLPARKLHDICRSLPEQAMLKVALTGDRVSIRAGKSRFTLGTLPAEDFPLAAALEAEDSVSLPATALRELIELTHFSMAQQDVRYYLNGLMLELGPTRLRSVATDGHRLAVSEMSVDTNFDDIKQVIIPRKGVQELLKVLGDETGDVELQFASNHLAVEVGGFRMLTKLIEGRFPDYQKVIPERSDHALVADRESLRQALVRASILSNEKYRGVRLRLEGQRLQVQAQNPEQEEAEEEVEIDFPGSAMEVGFNVTYLLDAINAVPATDVRIQLKDANSSCLIEHLDGEARCQYVIMPMRL